MFCDPTRILDVKVLSFRLEVAALRMKGELPPTPQTLGSAGIMEPFDETIFIHYGNLTEILQKY